MDKYKLVEKIRELEGLTNEEKSALVELLRSQKKYGLVWEDKPEDVEERLRNELPLLTEVKDKVILSGTPDAPNHILIEGDNLEALTILSYTHAGKIDVIYIDPPYNTGATNWKYNNNYVDSQDSFRHSKWLSFMNKRLRIAKTLLSDKGIIIVTIDDYEVENLVLLMNEIFGEKNRLGTFVVKNNPSGRSTLTGASISHEYALFYCCHPEVTLGRLPRNEKQLARYKVKDDLGNYEWVNFRKHGGFKNDAPSMYYPIYINSKTLDFRVPKLEWNENIKEYKILESPLPDEIVSYPIDEEGHPRRWKWGLDRFLAEKDEVMVRRDRSKELAIYIKSRMNDEGMLPLTIWDDKKYSSTEYGANLLSNIIGKGLFEYPKSLYAVIDSLKVGQALENATILDFFAGSGTTLHATMQLNAEDGGHRQCILVTNNENNICEDVTYERNRRVIQGYTTPKGEKVEGLKANNLRYYKTTFLSRDRTTQNMRNLMTLSTDMLCIRNDIYKEMAFGDSSIDNHSARYFSEGEKQMLVIYQEEKIKAIVSLIQIMPRSCNKMLVYVFSPNSYPYSDDFEEVADRIELCPLPEAIYKAYNRILPKRVANRDVESATAKN